MYITAIMLNGHVDQIVLYIYPKTQPTEISTSHVIVMYGSKTNLPLKCHLCATYANFFMCRYQANVSIYMPDMNSLQSTV